MGFANYYVKQFINIMEPRDNLQFFSTVVPNINTH
jgi:hypothetical protein